MTLDEIRRFRELQARKRDLDKLPGHEAEIVKLEIEMLQLQVDDLKEKPRRERQAFWRGSIVSVGSIVLGCILTGVIQECQKVPQEVRIQRLSARLESDTISVLLIGIDTSLVHLVRRTPTPTIKKKSN